MDQQDETRTPDDQEKQKPNEANAQPTKGESNAVPYQKKLVGHEPNHLEEEDHTHSRIQPQLSRLPSVLLATLAFAVLASAAWGYLGPKSNFNFGKTLAEPEKTPAPGQATSVLADAPNSVTINTPADAPVENPISASHPSLRQQETRAAFNPNSISTPQADYDQQMRMQMDMQRQQVEAQREQVASQREQEHQARMQKILEAPSTVYSSMDTRNSLSNPVSPGDHAIEPALNDNGSPNLLQGRLSASNASAYLPHTRMPAISPYEIKAGTVIPSVMLSGINSDLPGEIIAQVVQNVYDSATGKYLLIPQGAKLVGNYDHNLVLGQQRVLIAWNRIIYPDSSSVDIQGMAGQDQSGYAGFYDKTNHHVWPAVRQALLLSAISAGAQLSQPRTQRGDYSYSAPQIGAAAMGQQLNQLGMYSYQSRSNMVPTITIRPGYRFNVMVNKDMVLAPWQGETANQPAPILKTAFGP